MGILLIPAAEMRLEGADVILLNVAPEEIESLRTLDDLAALRAERGPSLFTIAPHPFYFLGGSLGEKLVERIDCFDAIELCHFWSHFFNPNRRAVEIAERFGKPLIATSDAHRLHAFGSNYTSIPRPGELTVGSVIAALRSGPHRLTNPPCSFIDLMSTIYFVFIAHPLRRKKRGWRIEDGR
jgi:predicted metal-dependent phosphoesterase TrpH